MTSPPSPPAPPANPTTPQAHGANIGIGHGGASRTQRWTSAELLAHGQQAEILHGDQVYRLRLTALGKLILTK